MVTKEQAIKGREFHIGECTRYQGARGGTREHVTERWRANGRCKTWKRDPNAFMLPIKHGLKSYAYLNEANAHLFHALEDCPLNDPAYRTGAEIVKAS